MHLFFEVLYFFLNLYVQLLSFFVVVTCHAGANCVTVHIWKKVRIFVEIVMGNVMYIVRLYTAITTQAFVIILGTYIQLTVYAISLQILYCTQ